MNQNQALRTALKEELEPLVEDNLRLRQRVIELEAQQAIHMQAVEDALTAMHYLAGIAVAGMAQRWGRSSEMTALVVGVYTHFLAQLEGLAGPLSADFLAQVRSVYERTMEGISGTSDLEV